MKTKIIALLIIAALNFPIAIFASDKNSRSERSAVKIENKLSEGEVARLHNRIEEIRKMDKSDLTVKERRELRKELKGMKETLKRDGGYIYIGAGTLLLIILILLLI